jgi:hypothetical protein
MNIRREIPQICITCNMFVPVQAHIASILGSRSIQRFPVFQDRSVKPSFATDLRSISHTLLATR